MEAIMLTWNPEVWDAWDPPYPEAVTLTASGAVLRGRWSVANRVNIAVGTEAWFLLQGRQRGLLGHGVVVSEPFRDRHYADPSQTSTYVWVNFDWLLDIADRLPIEVLTAEVPSVRWNSFRSSGMTIPAQGAQELERIRERYSR